MRSNWRIAIKVISNEPSDQTKKLKLRQQVPIVGRIKFTEHPVQDAEDMDKGFTHAHDEKLSITQKNANERSRLYGHS